MLHASQHDMESGGAQCGSGLIASDIKSSIVLPRRRIKAIATWLLNHHPIHGRPVVARAPPPSYAVIRVVCISDTHNAQPDLPPGDILVHAGDLTENGSFAELDAQLAWLAAQPHPHKLVVAGNHDVLLDDAFLARHPARRYGDARTKADLPLGPPLTYLQDSSARVGVVDRPGAEKALLVYGSPWTPAYGVSAFQYARHEDPWNGAVPDGVDVLLTHGPPRGHLDRRDFHDAGCSYLAAEVFRLRPRLHVFGHIHAARGREDLVLDRARRIHDEVYAGWAGWPSVLLLAVDVLLANMQCLLLGRERMLARQRVTTFVNAATVGGPHNDIVNEAIVVEL
ncbi:hypothetical protein JDV02_000310 [Purpureocillium takamizusanense]|uniref:Calcineurin-like phosphoesterase domain-containing protein n=1 Tax=Purpureocillium takamizusanense TaxID=2060973 RepID=A0A9Q8V6Q7_9HYPO|nr:uncharacterized protein JDV02_000310 [Purpureocillium takamizusanense]UNI13581.1 hypothetical protein JDV02_000310 [Purpureocillium takamizusanense]